MKQHAHGAPAGAGAAARSIAPETLSIAVFGTLFGVLEITVGTALKTLRLPFTGVLMTALAGVLLVCARRFATRPGSTLTIAAVAALLKVFFMGGFAIGPVWAIVVEGLIAEVVLSGLGLHRTAAVLAGIAMVAYTTLHPLIVQRVLYGADILALYLETLRTALRALRLEQLGIPWLAGAWLFLVVGIGTVTGLAGHRLGREVEERVWQERTRQRAA